VCRQLGHNASKCPDQAFAKPKTPDPTEYVVDGLVIGCIDVEKDRSKRVIEIGVVITTYKGGKWVHGDSEFKVVVTLGTSSGWFVDNCPGLHGEMCDSKVTDAEAFEGLVKFTKDNKVNYLKAHNGVSQDFRELITSARDAGIGDPITCLQEAGIVGFIDPARFIPKYKMVEYQHPKKVTDDESAAGAGAGRSYLSNAAMFELATGKTMHASNLIQHRALDDAKAEREWLTKLPRMADIMFGVSSADARQKCSASVDSFRAYFDQYANNSGFVANGHKK
jgi:DNA polymerase III epsilon subunit-like protein